MKIKITDIKPNPSNPRVIKDDKFKKLVESIKSLPEMAEVRPIVVNKDMIVLGGNMRLKAMKEAGWKEVPVQIVDWPEDKQREFIIKDNVGFGEWEWQLLSTEWDVEQLGEWGLDVPAFAINEAEAQEDDYEIPDEVKTDIVIGDLFEIGQHRLLCGDSTDSDQVAKLMNGEKADMVFTDPPYGVNFQSNWRNNKSVTRFDVLLNDDTTLDILPIILLFAKYEAALFIWTAHQVYPVWRQQFESIYINTIIWNKGKMGMGDLNSYGNNYEMALFCSSGKPKLKGERKKAIWEINIDNGADYLHPTQKPIALSAYAIPDFTKESEVILDLFLGSGSTMVAAHQLKRKCYGMELDPKYCQVILERMKKLDPSLQIKKNGINYEITTNA